VWICRLSVCFENGFSIAIDGYRQSTDWPVLDEVDLVDEVDEVDEVDPVSRSWTRLI
jgi:hypothetical protein